MPVTEQYNPISAVGSGAADQFIAVPDQWFTYSNVKAEHDDTEIAWTKVAGGIQLNSVIPNGETIIVTRNTPLTQSNDFISSGRMPAEDISEEFDRQVLIDQEIAEQAERVVTNPPGTTLPGGGIIQEPDTLLGQDANGDFINRDADETTEFLGINDLVNDAEQSANEAAASAAAAAASEAAAATSAAEAEESNVNASKAVLDLSSKSFQEALFQTGTGDNPITGDVVIALTGSPPITIKNSARPYTEDNAINGVGTRLSDLWPDVVKIIQGHYTDYDTDEEFGDGTGPTISNPNPIIAWDVESYQSPYDDSTLYKLIYYGSETSIDLDAILPSPYQATPSTLSPPSDLPFLEKSESPFSFQLPVICQRVKDLSNPAYQGTVPNWVTLMTFGDSLGHRVHNNLSTMMTRKLSLAGIGFDVIQYNVTAGTVNIPGVNTQRRQDLWGPGTCMQFEDGGVLEFGALFAGATVVPFNCTDISLYLVSEPGGGSITIEQSKDSGSTWTVLESGISTDAAQAALIKTYEVTEGTHMFRMTASGGNVEFIGALLRNEKHKGFVDCRSATGGNPLSGFVQGDTAILNAVMADVDPDLVISHYYEDNADVVSSFDTYADQIEAAASSADHCYLAEHEQDATGQKEAENNPIYRNKARTLPRLQIWETGKVFQSWENAVDLGWTSDPIHYDDAAWRFQASQLIRHFGLDGVPNIEIVGTNQDGTTDRFEIRPHRTSVNVHLDYLADEDVDQYFKFQWDDPNNTSSTAERYWSFQRHSSLDATSPEGFQLNRYTSSGFQNVAVWDKLGRGYFGVYNVSTLPPAFEATGFFHESSTGKAAVAARHFTATQNAIEVYQGSNTSNLNATIKASGIAMFQTLDVSNWATAADDTEAAGAGVAVGNAYKTATGELRYRVS